MPQKQPHLRKPLVSILLCTSRPSFLEHALGQVEKQTLVDRELVLILHGGSFPSNEEITARYEGDLQILRVPDSVVFGDALNRGVAAARGSLIAKMDDDDWYGENHLSGLVTDLEASGADMVARGAEFVYLEELDITIRRMSADGCTFNNRNVGGGTFLIKKSVLQEVGGWQSIERHVDQALLDDLVRCDKTWYRGEGTGYVLHRRESGHTWDADVDYFLDQSEEQYRGLALDVAMPTG